MKKTKSFQESLIKALRDPREAAAYLNAVLREGDSTLLLVALRDVAQARGGMTELSRKTRMHRGNLYKMLSKRGKPEIQSVETVLKAVGLQFSIIPDKAVHLHQAA